MEEHEVKTHKNSFSSLEVDFINKLLFYKIPSVRNMGLKSITLAVGEH